MLIQSCTGIWSRRVMHWQTVGWWHRTAEIASHSILIHCLHFKLLMLVMISTEHEQNSSVISNHILRKLQMGLGVLFCKLFSQIFFQIASIVKVSEFFCYPEFTWSQFLVFLKFKKCQFSNFRTSSYSFSLYGSVIAKFPFIPNSEPLKT